MSRLLYEKEQDGRTSLSEYRFRSEGDGKKETWELYQGEPERHLTEPLKMQRMVIEELDDERYSKTWSQYHWRDGQLHTDSVVREVYHRFAFGDRKVSRTVDPDGEQLATTLTYYGDEAGGFPITGRVKSIQWADGNWDYYTYAADGRDARVYTPVGNTPLPLSEPTIGKGIRCVAYDYDGEGYQERRREIVEGVVHGVRYRKWNPRLMGVDHEIVEIEAVSPDAAIDDRAIVSAGRYMLKARRNCAGQRKQMDLYPCSSMPKAAIPVAKPAQTLIALKKVKESSKLCTCQVPSSKINQSIRRVGGHTSPRGLMKRTDWMLAFALRCSLISQRGSDTS